MVDSESLYQCPLCKSQLRKIEKSWQCENNHSFDIAKEGYVNLLPVQNKKSKAPGDSKDMLQARRQFLSNNFYDPLVTELHKTICEQNANGPILDLGCGEGFYLRSLAKRLNEQSPELSHFGIDIAKPGIQMAAKSFRAGEFCVGSAFKTPYLDNFFSIILCVFSPYEPDEVARILNDNGCFILVGPGPEHLKELAARVYNKVRKHAGNSQAISIYKGLTWSNERHVKTKVRVPGQYLSDLLAMTPYYWSTSESDKKELSKCEVMTITLDFVVEIYMKN